MTTPVVDEEGVWIRISDTDGDDFIRGYVSVLAKHPSGAQVGWKLPSRLMARLDVCQAVCEEIAAELEERVAQLPDLVRAAARLAK